MITKLCSGGCGTQCDENELDAEGRCSMCASILKLRDTLVKKGKVRLHSGTQQSLLNVQPTENKHPSQPPEN